MIRQFLTESLLLALLGGALGVLLANWMTELIQCFLPNSPLPLGFSLRMDSRILGFTLLLTLASA